MRERKRKVGKWGSGKEMRHMMCGACLVIFLSCCGALMRALHVA